MRFYPNVVTLRPEVTEPEVLAAVAASGPFAVKDSFARLDLAPAGFRLLAEATWIARDGPPTETAEAATAEYGTAEDGLTWDQVTAPNELSEWEKAWADGDGVSGMAPCSCLACCRIRAARSWHAAGRTRSSPAPSSTRPARRPEISNMFTSGISLKELWAGIQRAKARLWPHLPAVGYEDGTSLEAARQAGFHALGSLRIWVR